VQFSDSCGARLICDACRGSCHSSRRSSSTGQQAGEQVKGEGEEGAVSAIVDKLWKDLQIERVSKSWNILFSKSSHVAMKGFLSKVHSHTNDGKGQCLQAIQCRQA